MKDVLLIDDHSIVRTGVANVIRGKFTGVNIIQSDNILSAYSNLEKRDFDLAIIDIKLPGGSTLDLVKHINENSPSTKILMFSGLDEAQYGERYLKLNVNGFLSKNEPVEEILNAIDEILNGNLYMSDELKVKLNSKKLRKDKNPVEQLSTRELEVLSYILDGYGNLEIATELDLKNSTVSTYKKRLMEKFEVNNVLDLVEKYKLYAS
ncbi:MAG: response regulator transcription factor [Flavobacteriaceae bacterium]|nr:response regulator transcription factor [Flavobacteriaceae bacterium]